MDMERKGIVENKCLNIATIILTLKISARRAKGKEMKQEKLYTNK